MPESGFREPTSRADLPSTGFRAAGVLGFCPPSSPQQRSQAPERTALSNVCCCALLTGWDLMMSGYRLRKDSLVIPGHQLVDSQICAWNPLPTEMSWTALLDRERSLAKQTLLPGALVFEQTEGKACSPVSVSYTHELAP